MTETPQTFVPWSSQETRTFHDALMISEAMYGAADDAAAHAGWMTWKKNATGKEYLFHGKDRAGNGTLLGPRSTATEARYAEFQAAKTGAAERVSKLRAQATTQSKFIRAVRLNRMPRDAAKVLRFFERTAFADALLVIGTHALYAYETAAGGRFVPDSMATRDVDLLWDAKKNLEVSLTIPEDKREGFLDVLHKIDKTFTVSAEQSFRVTSAQGLTVDFLMPEPDDGRKPKRGDKVRPRDKVRQTGIKGQAWLLATPPLRQIVFSDDGYPVRLSVPQPTLFATHKLWVADQKSRRAEKRDRDREQAHAVLALLKDRLGDGTPVRRKLPPELRAYFP